MALQHYSLQSCACMLEAVVMLCLGAQCPSTLQHEQAQMYTVCLSRFWIPEYYMTHRVSDLPNNSPLTRYHA